MRIRIAEKNKRDGVHYALTNDGLELPVIDITHPAFCVKMDAAEQDRLFWKFARARQEADKVPAWANPILRLMLRSSRLGQGILSARGKYLGGIDTYLMKLCPDHLGKGYAGAVDRMIASSFPGTMLRIRLQNTARLLATGLAPLLAKDPSRPLHFLNIAGGPGSDSLNALLLIHKECPESLRRRPIHIHVLDLEPEGTDFGCRCLEALLAKNGPLCGLNIAFEGVHYDWSCPAGLARVLAPLARNEPIVAGSSEGGLFEYGTDPQVEANLKVFRNESPRDSFCVGSVSRDDELLRRFHAQGKVPIYSRGLAVFERLANRAGWTIDSAIKGTFSDQVRLVQS